MTKFLILLPLPDEHDRAFEPLLRTAVTFLEARGPVERANLGGFARSGRKSKRGERLDLVALTTTAGADTAQDFARARALEDVLRSTLISADIGGVEPRVFVATEQERE